VNQVVVAACLRVDAMHAIPVRRLTFDVPAAERFHPVYMAGHAAVSCNFTGLGLYVAQLEPCIASTSTATTRSAPACAGSPSAICTASSATA